MALPREFIDTAVAHAERAATAGRSRDALDCYVILLGTLLREQARDLQGIDATSAWAIERTAELAIINGRTGPAADLLEVSFNELVQSENRYVADLIAAKRLQLAVLAGDLRCIAEVLEHLQATVGHFEAIKFRSSPALERLEQSCAWPDARSHERSIFFAEFYQASAKLLTWLGQCADGEAALQRGLIHAAAVAAEMPPLRSSMQLDLISITLLRGDHAAARAQLAALPNTSDPISSVRRAELTATAAVLAGEFAATKAALTTARTICETFEFDAALVKTLLSLGGVQLILNCTAEIDALVDEAMPIAAQLGDVRLSQRLARLRALATARRTSNAEAFLPFAPISHLWGQEDDPTDERTVTATAGGIELPTDGCASVMERLSDYTLGLYQLFQLGDTRAAAEWYEQMQEVFTYGDSPLIHHRLRLLGAMSSYYRDDYICAAALLDALLGDLRRLGLRHDLWLACCFRLWCYARLGDRSSAHASLAAEARCLVDVMGQGLSAAERATFELNKWSEDEAYLAARFEDLRRQLVRARRRWWLGRWIDRVRVWVQLDDLIAQLDSRRAAVLHARVPNEARPRWWSRLVRRQRGRLTISFLALPNQMFAVREGFLHLDFVPIPMTRLKLREYASAWHEVMRRWYSAVEETHRSREEQYAALLEGLSAEFSTRLKLPRLLNVRSIRHLRVVPDDSLHGIPFAALLHEGQRLVERFALSLDVQHVPTRGPRRLQVGSPTALVAAMGLPNRGCSALGQANQEAKQVAAVMRARGFAVHDPLLLDERATPQAIVAGLRQSTVAHIVCHGQFSIDSMEQTGLRLFGDGNSTLLSLMDLAKLDLTGLASITLSSCWSADNYILPGRTVVNLPQVVRSAGAQSVLSCLWKVDDEVGEMFFRRFYELTKTLPELQALRRTQAEFADGTFHTPTGAPTNALFHWAGYTLHCAG